MRSKAIAVLAYNNEDFGTYEFEKIPEDHHLVYIGLPSHVKGREFVFQVETPAFKARPDSKEMRALVAHVPTR